MTQEQLVGQAVTLPKRSAPRRISFKVGAVLWFVAFVVGTGLFPLAEWGALPSLVIASGVTFGLVWWQKDRLRKHFAQVQAWAEDQERIRQQHLEALSRIRPEPRLFKTFREAEDLAREWMMYFGFVDSALTNAGADAGIDVESAVAVAQVKAWSKPVGRPVVQQTFGAAVAVGKRALVFALGGYTAEATSWADEYGVALFEFNHAGMVEAANSLGRQLIERGDARALGSG